MHGKGQSDLQWHLPQTDLILCQNQRWPGRSKVIHCNKLLASGGGSGASLIGLCSVKASTDALLMNHCTSTKPGCRETAPWRAQHRSGFQGKVGMSLIRHNQRERSGFCIPLTSPSLQKERLAPKVSMPLGTGLNFSSCAQSTALGRC